MRRVLVLSALVVVTLAGLGCRNLTTGRCDCTNNPADAEIIQPHNPYATIGPAQGGAPVSMPEK